MKQIELLIKPVSFDCNLNCEYCFYRKTSNLYPGRFHHMSEKVLEKLISESMRYSEGRTCVFSWQGGEPLLAGLDFFRKAIALEKKYGKQGQIVSNSIQTNGTMLNMEWIRLFRDYNFLIGISLDGPPQIHNRYRRYPSGKGSFEKVMEGINLLRKGGVEFNILATIGKETGSNPEEILDFFLSEGFFYVQFIPAVDRTHDRIADFSLTPTQYGDFLCRLFDRWWNRGSPLISLRQFDSILEILLQGNSSFCKFRNQCGQYIVVEFNGDTYPCDFFVRKEWKLGNIFQTSIKRLFEEAKSRFGKWKEKAPSDCSSCHWNFICHNGCPWFRWIKNGNMGDKDYFCEAYKKFLSSTIERFEKLRGSLLLRRYIRSPKSSFLN